LSLALPQAPFPTLAMSSTPAPAPPSSLCNVLLLARTTHIQTSAALMDL
jgi:hypothetical protein